MEDLFSLTKRMCSNDYYKLRIDLWMFGLASDCCDLLCTVMCVDPALPLDVELF